MDIIRRLFYERQTDLLWIANSPVGKKLLRYELDFPIIQLFPNSYRIKTDDKYIKKNGIFRKASEYDIYIDRFFTYSKVAELFLPILTELDLYRQTVGKIEKPYEALLHYSRFEQKNNKYPQFLHTTSTFAPNAGGSGSGRLQSSNATYSTAVAGSGISKVDSIGQILNWLNGGVYAIDRLFHPFNTAALPDDATISSAFLRYVGSAGTENVDGATLYVLASTQANMASLSTGDWDNITSVPYGTKTFASWNASGNNDITLDSSGISNINVSGTSGFGARTNRDVSASAPTGHNVLGITSISDMLLSVTYTVSSPSASLSPSASVSPSSSISPSASVSPSLSPSASRSPSSSISASISPSSSVSPSSSISASISPSASLSPSSSISPSLSPSSSISSSTSPSPSAGYTAYTRQASSGLPATDGDLSTHYTDQEVTNVSTEDGIDVGQKGTLTFMIHQFKKFIEGQTFVDIEFEGHSTLAPSQSPVYLQVYNQQTSQWETVDSNRSADEEIDFELEGKIASPGKYKDSHGLISCRVYQLAI